MQHYHYCPTVRKMSLFFLAIVDEFSFTYLVIARLFRTFISSNNKR